MFYSNRRTTKIHVEVENSKFSSVNWDFYGIQLTLVWPQSLSRDLAISSYSVIGSSGHSKSSNIMCMSTLPASIIVWKALGRDCTNNNGLILQIGVLSS